MIRLEDVRLSADAFQLDIKELALEPGEYLVILGPTGSGKTVLLETIAGLRRPAQGQVWFGERDVTREPPERRRAGFVYQDYALFPHLTVAKNIAFGVRDGRMQGGERLRVRNRHDARGAGQVEHLASLLGIRGLLDRYPQSLSGGEQQRVALARALAVEPDVLLLDEPLSALDRTTRNELRGELRRLHGELRPTVMHVTHDLDEALALGDRMAVLIDGRLHQIGPPGEVIRHPTNGDVARLVGMTNVFPVASSFVDDGGVHVRLDTEKMGAPLGEIELVAACQPAQSLGEAALAVIRSEEIVLLGAGDAPAADVPQNKAQSQNLLEGVVKDVQLQSVHACLEVDVPPIFSVHVLRPEVERLHLALGSRVQLRIPPEAVHICAASNGALRHRGTNCNEAELMQ